MRLPKFAALALIGLLAGSFGSTAFAKSDSPNLTIETTGVATFDNVFAKAGSMLKSIVDARTNIDTANKNVDTALGLKEGTPLKDALADLKTKAAGKIKVAMNGTTPKLEPTDAVPENVKKGIDAVNGLMDATSSATTSMTQVAKDSPALVTECSAFADVGKVTSEIKAAGISSPLDLAKILKKVAGDVKVVQSMPGEAKKVVDGGVETFNIVKSAF
jgi:hypothetical protein